MDDLAAAPALWRAVADECVGRDQSISAGLSQGLYVGRCRGVCRGKSPGPCGHGIDVGGEEEYNRLAHDLGS